jgi:hypothetical protein
MAFSSAERQPLGSPRLWAALALTLIALVAMAITNQIVPYGWKVFVLAKIFKIAWATSVAFALAASAVFFLPRIVREADLQCAQTGPGSIRAISVLAAALLAFVTLGYLLPDWDPWTEGIGAAVLGVWAIILAAAGRLPASRRQQSHE